MTASEVLSSGPIWGVVAAAITAFGAWVLQRSKGQVDESASVRQQWEKLTSGLSDRLSKVEGEFADYRAKMAQEIEAIRKAHADEIAELRRVYDARLKAQQELNEGLQRQIIQNSQSSAQMLGEGGKAARGRARHRLGEDDE